MAFVSTTSKVAVNNLLTAKAAINLLLCSMITTLNARVQIQWILQVYLLFFGSNITFNNLSVISRRYLDAAGSSMLTFRVLHHKSISPQTHVMTFASNFIPILVWPVLIPSSTFIMLSAKPKSRYRQPSLYRHLIQRYNS